MDVKKFRVGSFPEQLLTAIEATPNFLVVLSPESLTEDDGDGWFQREIAHALETKRNIIPIMIDGFNFPSKLPSSISALARQNSIPYSDDFVDETLQKIISNLVVPAPNPVLRRRAEYALALTVALVLVGFAVNGYRRASGVTPAALPNKPSETHDVSASIAKPESSQTHSDDAQGTPIHTPSLSRIEKPPVEQSPRTRTRPTPDPPVQVSSASAPHTDSNGVEDAAARRQLPTPTSGQTVTVPESQAAIGTTTSPIIETAAPRSDERASSVPISGERRVDADPTPNVTSPVDKSGEDRKAIEAALARYVDAYEHLDTNRLRSLWPSMPDSLVTQLGRVTLYKLTLSDVDIVIQGDDANVTCIRHITMQSVGRNQSVTPPTKISLRRAPPSWLITKVE